MRSKKSLSKGPFLLKINVRYDNRKEFLAVEIGPGSSEPCFKACVTPTNILKVSQIKKIYIYFVAKMLRHCYLNNAIPRENYFVLLGSQLRSVRSD